MDHSKSKTESTDPTPRVVDADDLGGTREDTVQFSLDQALDAATRVDGRLNLRSEGPAADPSLVRLHELLGFPQVALPPDFAEGVMGMVGAGEVRQARPSAARLSWLFAVAGAAGLLLAIALLGGINSTGDSVFAGLAGGIASVVLAGAGMLAATWSGVGVSVGSWLGTSPTIGAFLALAFVGSLLGLGLGLRRARQRGNTQ